MIRFSVVAERGIVVFSPSNVVWLTCGVFQRTVCAVVKDSLRNVANPLLPYKELQDGT